MTLTKRDLVLYNQLNQKGLTNMAGRPRKEVAEGSAPATRYFTDRQRVVWDLAVQLVLIKASQANGRVIDQHIKDSVVAAELLIQEVKG